VISISSSSKKNNWITLWIISIVLVLILNAIFSHKSFISFFNIIPAIFSVLCLIKQPSVIRFERFEGLGLLLLFGVTCYFADDFFSTLYETFDIKHPRVYQAALFLMIISYVFLKRKKSKPLR